MGHNFGLSDFSCHLIFVSRWNVFGRIHGPIRRVIRPINCGQRGFFVNDRLGFFRFFFMFSYLKDNRFFCICYVFDDSDFFCVLNELLNFLSNSFDVELFVFFFCLFRRIFTWRVFSDDSCGMNDVEQFL